MPRVIKPKDIENEPTFGGLGSTSKPIDPNPKPSTPSNNRKPTMDSATGMEYDGKGRYPYNTPEYNQANNILNDYYNNNKVGDFNYGNQSVLDELRDKILNREDFSYDFNSDAMYQQYKDQYTKLGNEAAMNAAASASALTGGYGSSYAGTAASQANQQYLTQLNNVIPELYNAALNRYNTETENLYNQYGMMNDDRNFAYGQYQDKKADYWNNVNYLAGRADAAYGRDSDRNNFNYNQYRDSVADEQWNKEFEFQQEQFDWQKEQANLKRSGSGGGRGSGRGGSGKSSNKPNDEYAASNKQFQSYLANAKSLTHASSGDMVSYQFVQSLINKKMISVNQGNSILKALGVSEDKYFYVK